MDPTVGGWSALTTLIRSVAREVWVGGQLPGMITAIDRRPPARTATRTQQLCWRISGMRSRRCSTREAEALEHTRGRNRELRGDEGPHTVHRARRAEAPAWRAEDLVQVCRELREGPVRAKSRAPGSDCRGRTAVASGARGAVRAREVEPLEDAPHARE